MKYDNNMRLEQKTALYFKGKRITEHIYDNGYSQNGITVMQRGNVIDVYSNESGVKLSHQANVTNFTMEKQGIVLFNGKCCSMRTYNGNIILEEKYLSITNSEGFIKTIDLNGNKALYLWENNTLKEIISPQKCECIDVNIKGIIVHKMIGNKKYKGYYSLDGKELIPPKYEEILFNIKGIYVITHDNNLGFYTHSGKEIIPPLYSEILPAENCFVVYNKTSFGKMNVGLYTNNGIQILESKFSDFYIKKQHCIFRLGQLYCICDIQKGRIVLPLKYRKIGVEYNVIYATEDSNLFYLYSGETGNKLLEDGFEDVKLYAPYIFSAQKDKHTYYYLSLYNILVDSSKYDVEYSNEYKEILITKKRKGVKLTLTEWLNKQG